MNGSSVAEVVARLHRGGLHLEIGTTDLCFLAAIHVRNRDGEGSSLDEASLRDLYAFVSEVTEPAAPNVQKRATHALERLRDQRLLARVDGAGIVRAGDWTLTRLSTGILDYYLEEGALTRQSLLVLCSTLRATLHQVLLDATTGGDDRWWDERVLSPLRVTVSDLIRGIDRRQQGLDEQQDEVRARVAGLLEKHWSDALESCEALLDETARTLRELGEVLLVETGAIVDLVEQIGAVSSKADRHVVEATAHGLAGETLRVGAWGSDRMDAWDAYFGFIQRYLRTVVRLDAGRATSERLREAIRSWGSNPWGIRVPEPPPLRALRDPEARLFLKPVVRPRAARDRPPRQESPPVGGVDIAAEVASLLASGEARLVDALATILPQVPPGGRYGTTGEVVEELALAGIVRRPRDEAWVAAEGLEVQDLVAVRRLRPRPETSR